MTHRALFLLFLSAAAASFGQSNLASISGVVTDAQGASMPGAKVSFANRTPADALMRAGVLLYKACGSSIG